MLTTAQTQALAPLIETFASALSEDTWCAGWMLQWEHTLWDGLYTDDGGVLSDRDRRALQTWVALTDTWLMPDDTAEGFALKLVPLSEWIERHAAWKTAQNEMRKRYQARTGRSS